jgi:ADP-ribose pyrophosphatase YjhB (NUDIX family)
MGTEPHRYAHDGRAKPRQTRVAAYALVRASNRILLCRLSTWLPRWKGYWTLPGGGLKFGESPEDAMVREVAEETGLVVEARSLARIDSILDTSGDTDFHGIRIIYHADVVGGELRHEAAGSTDRCDWHEFHPTPAVNLVDLAEIGVRMAQDAWPDGTHRQRCIP